MRILVSTTIAHNPGDELIWFGIRNLVSPEDIQEMKWRYWEEWKKELKRCFASTRP